MRSSAWPRSRRRGSGAPVGRARGQADRPSRASLPRRRERGGKTPRDPVSVRSAMRQVADAAVRNAGPILEVLARVLPASGRVLEVGSGTGQHAVTFAAALPGLSWQPSDPSESARASIAAWIEHAGVTNVLPPIDLDARMRPWPVPDLVAVVCINVVH